MLKDIVASSRYIMASGGGTSMPYVPSNANNPIQGMVRVHNQDMQVFDGSGWVTIYNSIATVSITPEAESLLDWARKKREEELAWQSLATDNQAVKIALDNLEQARRQLDITAQLAREYDTKTTS